jgi:hypothetical protein
MLKEAVCKCRSPKKQSLRGLTAIVVEDDFSSVVAIVESFTALDSELFPLQAASIIAIRIGPAYLIIFINLKK